MALEFKISQDLSDWEWDSFVHRATNGHHVQSSLWSQLKSMHDWSVLRLMAVEDGWIIAGVQILLKRIPLFGVIGYASNGPIFASENQMLQKQFLIELNQLTVKHRIQVLFIQPPRGADGFERLLARSNYRLTEPSLASDATVLIDLAPDLDDIFKGLKKRKRYNIRYAERNGIETREGGVEDLPLFYELLKGTTERQGFEPYPLEYFQRMYELYAQEGYVGLLFAEHEGEPLSALFLVGHGDTVMSKKGGWNGQKGNLRPNEALEWAAIQWSKARGYCYYDLEGIDRNAAEAILTDAPLPTEIEGSPTEYKLGYGGEVRLLPRTYTYVKNPVFSWMYYSIYPRVSNSRLFDTAIRKFRAWSGGRVAVPQT